MQSKSNELNEFLEEHFDESNDYFDDDSYINFSEPAENNKGEFKLYGTHFFLTYNIPESLNNLSLDEVLNFFKTKFEDLFKRCIVSFEKSKTKQKHIHVYLGLKKRKYYSKKEYFDLTIGDVTVKGQYLKAKSQNLRACKKYVKKGGNFVDSCPDADSEEDEDRAITKKYLRREIARIYMAHKDDLPKVKELWVKLLTDFPYPGLQLLTETTSLWNALVKETGKSKGSRQSAYDLHEFFLPSPIMAYILLSSHLALVIESATGFCKTAFVLSLGESLYGVGNILKINNIIDLAELDPHIALLLLDDLGGIERDVKEPSQLFHVFDPEQDSRIRVLYKAAPVEKGLRRVFTTNNFKNLIKVDTLCNETKEAIFRRFCYVRLSEPLNNTNYEADKKILDLTNRPIYRRGENGVTNGIFTAEMLNSFIKNYENNTLPEKEDVFFIKEGVTLLQASQNSFSLSCDVQPTHCQERLCNKVLLKAEQSLKALNP